MPSSITAVIPAHNEAAPIGRVVEETLPHVDEVLVVDDSSTDDTRSVTEAAGARAVSSQLDKGYIGRLKTGFQGASGDIVVTLDADGEHDPADIPKLIEANANDRTDLVLGRRALGRSAHQTAFNGETAPMGVGPRRTDHPRSEVDLEAQGLREKRMIGYDAGGFHRETKKGLIDECRHRAYRRRD